MIDVDGLTDAELRTKLIEFGFPVMPITGTTRKVMVKKLKILMENKNKTDNDGRRSLARYSSDEESDPEVKISKREKNRRATMAAPSTRVPVRKSSQKQDVNADVVRKPVVTEEKKITTRTTRTTKITESEFDTGSDTETEVVESELKSNSFTSPVTASSPLVDSTRTYSSLNKPSFGVESPIHRPVSYASHSPSRYTSFGASGADTASDRLNQIRSRLSLGTSNYDTSSYSSVVDQNDEKVDTPFLSNFTRRLSQLSANNSQKQDFDFKNDIIKEHDTNGSGSYGTRTYLSRPVRRDFTRDYRTGKENHIKNNLVSYTVIALAFLFFLILAVVYTGMHNGQTALDPIAADLVVPYCDKIAERGKSCILDGDVQGAVDLYKVIKPELIKRAITHRCSDSKVKPYMTEGEVVKFVQNNYGLKDQEEIEDTLNNMEILSFTNPKWEISLLQSESGGGWTENLMESMADVLENRKSKEIIISVLHPNIPWKCSLYNKIATIIQTVLVLSGGFLALYFTNTGYKYYKHYRQKQKDELFYMVERIIDTLQNNAGEDGDNFLVINHVRDMILPLNDRQRMEKTWKRAVKFINENESRVRTELQVVQGEPYEVWRWLGSPSLNTSRSPSNKSWQGQAFETQVGSVNSLPCSPTPCLKIRGMVDDGDRNLHTIKEAVLSKCAHQCRILHCAVDTNSKCVYLKCADQNDAAIAYRSLHGWWYAGNLLTVKYLRLERYMQRYPDSPVSGPPFLKALQPAADWTS